MPVSHTHQGQLRSLMRRVRVLFLVLIVTLTGLAASAAAASPPVLSVGNVPASADAFPFINGCGGDLAAQWNVVCPVSSDVATYIAYVKGVPGGVSIVLTRPGIDLGLTCDGAAWLVRMASDEYDRLPGDVRGYDGLLWADPYITSEVMGHSIAAATNIPQLVRHGNPIDIVFADYSTPGSQGLFWRAFDDPSKPFAPGACAGNVI